MQDKKKPVVCYDLQSKEWREFLTLPIAAVELGLKESAISNSKHNQTAYLRKWFFCNPSEVEIIKEKINELHTTFRIKERFERGSIRVNRRVEYNPIQVYNARTGKWVTHINIREAAKAAGIAACTVEAHLNTLAFFNEQYLFCNKSIDTQTVTIPETDYYVTPTTKEEEDALRRRLELWPYGPKWEQLQTLEGWDALMLKINEEIEEFNLASYGKRIESAGGALNNKAVYQFDLDGNFIKKYDSAKEAIKEHPKAYNLREACRGNISHCNGFKWSYTGELKQEEDDEQTPQSDEYDY